MRVLLAESSRGVRDGLRTIINSEAGLEVVGEASDGQAALAAIIRLRPDVVVVAVDLEGLDGLEVTRRVAGSPASGDPPVPVLVIGGDGLEGLVAAVRAGARGYLRRRVVSDGLVAAVRALGSGGGHLGPAVTRQLLDYAAPRLPLPTPAVHPGLDELSDREREVLCLLGRGQT
ncbi:MAG TPA: response regulator transcription factor, partial [Solirubrobacteraceae bacterium]|nr:response regulator transcription factor [Solirubrobacteraceae bacterium]